MVTDMYSNAYRLTLICVDKYENKNPIGRVYSPNSDSCVEFNSTVELLLYVNSMLEKTKSPQSFSAIRSFKAVEDFAEPAQSSDVPKSGNLATFAVNILFRQNSSWQGSVLWSEGNQEESFRSVLELLFLMDSALSTESGK